MIRRSILLRLQWSEAIAIQLISNKLAQLLILTMLFVVSKIFSLNNIIYYIINKIYSVMDNIFFIYETVVFGIQKIFSVI
jgi:hypothetical protein